MTKSIVEVRAFVEQALVAVGAKREQAALVADVLIEADMRGIASHGIARLPRYLKAVRSGEIDLQAQPEVVREFGATACLDAHHGFGQVAGVAAMDKAIALATTFGLGLVTVFNSNHFGIAGYFAERAWPKMIGLAMTNTAPLVVPTGGKRSVLGTNPIAVAVPHGQLSWLMDFSTSAVSRGKIEVCQRQQLPLDPHWAVDGHGGCCGDAGQVLEILAKHLDGGIAPMADYKGYGLAAFVDILCGVLSGAGFGLQVGSGGQGNVGHCFICIDIERFLPEEIFAERMEVFCADLQHAAAPGKQVFLHGQKEQLARAESLKNGLTIAAETEVLLAALAKEVGLTF